MIKKIYSKTKSKKYVKPEQFQDVRIMTAREYKKTPGYQEKAKTQWKALFKRRVEPQYKQFEEITDQVNQQINTLGIPQMFEKIREQYSFILKDSQPKEIFISPK